MRPVLLHSVMLKTELATKSERGARWVEPAGHGISFNHPSSQRCRVWLTESPEFESQRSCLFLFVSVVRSALNVPRLGEKVIILDQ